MAPLSSPAILPLAQGVPGDDQSMLQDSPEQNANLLHVLPPTDGFLWFYCFPNFAISQVLTKQICASSSLPIRRDKAGSCPGVFVSFATQIAANSNFFVLNPLFPKCDTGQTTPRQGKHCIALKKKKKQTNTNSAGPKLFLCSLRLATLSHSLPSPMQQVPVTEDTLFMCLRPSSNH